MIVEMKESVQNYKQDIHYILQRKVNGFFHSVVIEFKSMPVVERGTFDTWVSAV